MAKGRVGRLRKAGPDAWDAIIDISRRFRGRGSRGQGERYIKNFRAMFAGFEQSPLDASPCCAIRDKLNEFLVDRMEGAGNRPCNEDTARLHRKRLERFDAAFHSKPINAVTRKEVKDWRNRRRRTLHNGEPVGRDTVNAELRSLYAFAKWAQKNEYAPPSLPLQTVGLLWEPGKVPGANRKPANILPVEQLLEVIERIGGVRRDVGLFLTGMYLYVLRPAAVWRLRRGDVHLPRRGGDGRLLVKGLKGRPDRRLLVKSGSAAHRWVLDCLALGGDGAETGDPLLICAEGHSRKNPGGWTTQSLDAAVAGIREELRLPFRFTPYTIRHSTLAWLQNTRHVAMTNIRDAADHAKLTTLGYYEHATGAGGEPVFDRLGSLFDAWKQPEGGSGRAVSGL